MTWTEKYAWIDLTSKKINIEKIPRNILKTFIGGKGLGAYFLNKYLNPTIDPLDPKNLFILSTGPAQGTVPIAGRYCIVTKSPHTGMFLDSHVGGYLGPELKFAGFDCIIVTGKASEPSYIQINNNDIEIKSAKELWGRNIVDTTDIIFENFDKKARVVAIGPAGENLVNYAATNSDYFRTAARGGVGMLFGSKNLKAIAIKGTNELEIKDKDKLNELRKEINKRAIDSQKKGHQLPKLGTSWLVDVSNGRDQLPTFNYQKGEWENAEKINGESIAKHFSGMHKRKPCYRCPLACSYVIDVDYEWADGKMIQHPEYESIGLLGSNLGISNIETISHANHLCNILGLDTISTGSTISWFMECNIRNAVPEKYKNEAIEFGDENGVLELIHKIAFKQGVGEILAKGVMRASEIFQNNSADWAVHVRGLELPAWDPRGKLGLGLSYITSNVGGSHLRGWPVTSEFPNQSALPVIDSMIEQQDLKILKDSLIMCHFTHSISPVLSIEDTAKIFEVLTGFQSNYKIMREKAHRIWTLSRQINIKIWEGKAPRLTDDLPKRLKRDQLPSGISKGNTSFVSDLDLQESLDYYYEKRNCSPEGIPKSEILIDQLT